jgi:hypothetical protein
VKRMQRVKEASSPTWHAMCDACGLPYSTLMRWRKRLAAGEPIVRKPGPKKRGKMRRRELKEQAACLQHGVHRSRGAGMLYAKVKDAVSRREFRAVLSSVRQKACAAARAAWTRIEWLWTGIVWAIDDTRLGTDEYGRRVYMHDTYELAARYKLTAIVGEFAHGPQVAHGLREQCEREGAPLFLKRDNGGNLNHPAVDEVLVEHGIIPLNNPPECAWYNGAEERSHGLFKRVLSTLADREALARRLLWSYVECARECVNHLPRRVLGGRTPCECYHDGKMRIVFTLKEREAIMWEIGDIAMAVYRTLEDQTPRGEATARRIAAQTWLESRGLIRVVRGVRVSPDFGARGSH